MTRVEWDDEWRACYNRLRAKGYEIQPSVRMARDITSARYGPRPDKPPLRLRLALGLSKLFLKKLEHRLAAREASMWHVYAYAALAALIAGIGAVQISGFPHDDQGWAGLLVVVLTAFAAKLSHPEKAMSPNAPPREVWTDERRQETREETKK